MPVVQVGIRSVARGSRIGVPQFPPHASPRLYVRPSMTTFTTSTTTSGANPGATPALALALAPELTDALAEHVANIVLARLGDRPEYMSTEDVARYLHWPIKRIDNLCAQRRIPFHKDGGRRVFVRHEIDDWVRQLPGPTTHEALLMAG